MDAIIARLPSAPPRADSPRAGTPGRTASRESTPESFAQQVPQRTASQNKRPLEDLSAYAGQTSRQLKLRRVDQQQLKTLASATPAQQRIFISGLLLKVVEHQESMTAPETLFVIPRKLKHKIELKAFSILVDPKTTCYVDPHQSLHGNGPAVQIWKLVKQNPQWGFTKAMLDDSPKCDVVVAYIRRQLSKRRSDIKGVVDAALIDEKHPEVKMNIVELTNTVLATYKKVPIQATADLVCRVALLRSVSEKKVSPKEYWKEVDRDIGLVTVLSAPIQHMALEALLNEDISKYGSCRREYDELGKNAPEDPLQGIPSDEDDDDEGEQEGAGGDTSVQDEDAAGGN